MAASTRRGRPAPGFTLQLLLLTVVPLAIVSVVIALASLALHAGAMRQLVGDRDRRAAEAAADAISRQLEHRSSSVRGLAEYAHAAAAPQSAIEHFAFLLPEFGGGLALFDASGDLTGASGPVESWAQRPLDQVLPAALRGETAFSATFDDPGTGSRAMLVSAGVAGGPAAVGAFFPAQIAEPLANTLLGAHSQGLLWIVDSRGRIVYASGPGPLDVDPLDHPGVADALAGSSGATYVPAGSSEHVVAFSPVPPVGWALVVEEPWEEVDSPLLRQTQFAPLILVPVVLVALLVVAFGVRQIVQPLRRLAGRASELGWGHYEAIEAPVGGVAEIGRLQAELVRMAHQVRAAQQSLRGYVSAITRGQEDERRRLARELHDGPVQALVALDQRVQMLQLGLKDGGPDVAERFAQLRQMTAALLDDVRRVIRALRPIYLEDLGLLPALEMLTRDAERSAGVEATFAARGQPTRLAPEREIAIYRVAQEALSNVARHAGAAHVRVEAVFDRAEFALRVQDNGRGFQAPERVSDLAPAGHYGLIGMQERAQLIGARLALASTPGQGTTVELRVPFAPEGPRPDTNEAAG